MTLRGLSGTAIVLALLTAGCASSGGVSAARRGDRAALTSYVTPLLRQGKLDNHEAAEIARASLEHEILAAKGDDAIERIGDASPCSSELESALEDRMKSHDAAGALAALSLYGAMRLSADDVREWLKDPDPAWRAVGVRSLVQRDDGEARRAALVDPDARVRRSAMRASGEAGDFRDLDALFEAARLDPVPMARNEAVRAIARIPTANPEVVNKLRDLWTNADDSLREDISSAYASPSVVAHGGAEAIRVLVASGHGPGVIAAAAAVMRSKKDTFGAETTSSAVALLARTIDSGSRRDRSFALAVAPIEEPSLLEAIKRASQEKGDDDIRVSALARLADVPSERSRAVLELQSIGQPGDLGTLSTRARLALARAGDKSVQAWLEKDLASENASTRLGAADGLASLGRAARGAPLLADADARVRTRAACGIVVAGRK